MKKVIIILICHLVAFQWVFAQWKPVGDRIKTKWADAIDIQHVLPEYPRPLMERSEWLNLNGLWDYAITNVGEMQPESFDGKILVPFAIESSLSGVGKSLGVDKELWYQRTFRIPSQWKGKRVLINFGAVDWKAEIWVNQIFVGKHAGGYSPFSVDVTDALHKGENTLTVKVWDPTDQSYQPRGKQASKPEGIWYTSVSGIWQTVWMEPVSDTYVCGMKTTPDIDNHTLFFDLILNTQNFQGIRTEVEIYDGTDLVSRASSVNGQPVMAKMPVHAKLWSPDQPFLYSVIIKLYNGNKLIDRLDSYAAMRKISTQRDRNGIVRIQLNNKDQFMLGPLDQGWWPDGLYTAPTDDALKYDLQKTKDFGFNMIRKHIKVEPARWYSYCDRMGILVWQDMPSGDKNPEWQMRQYFSGTEFSRSEPSETNYRKEWKEIIDALYSYPCIVMWIPFNEAWGQFKTKEITEWTKKYDSTRLVNSASGGNFYPTGDVLDLHHYPAPAMYLYDGQRANVLGEYGGIGRVVQNHIWEPSRNWGYIQFNTEEEVTREYVNYANQLKNLIPRGFCGGVYTQTTDVEIEVNGLMTYDRKVIKVNENAIRQINASLCHALDRNEE